MEGRPLDLWGNSSPKTPKSHKNMYNLSLSLILAKFIGFVNFVCLQPNQLKIPKFANWRWVKFAFCVSFRWPSLQFTYYQCCITCNLIHITFLVGFLVYLQCHGDSWYLSYHVYACLCITNASRCRMFTFTMGHWNHTSSKLSRLSSQRTDLIDSY